MDAKKNGGLEVALTRIAALTGTDVEDLRRAVESIRLVNESLTDIDAIALLLSVTPRGKPVVAPDVAAEIARLRSENEQLRTQVAALQLEKLVNPIVIPYAPPPIHPNPMPPTWPWGHVDVRWGGGTLSWNLDGSTTWKDDNGTVTHAAYDAARLVPFVSSPGSH